MVTIFSPKLLKNSQELTKKLREQKINTDLYPDSEIKLDKQLKYADQKGIPFAVIIGPDEAAKDLITIKNLQTKTQTTTTLEEAVKELR